MNSERNPHLLNDPSGGGGGCVIGSSTTPGPIHGYGSPPGSHGGVDMAVGQPCPVPTPPWVKPPSNNSGMMTPESDVSSCSSPASSSYGASSQNTTFPQPHMQPRTFYGTTNNYCNANTGNPISSSTNSASSGIFYDSSGEIVDQSQYYHHHHPPNHHQIPSSHQHHHHQQQQTHFQQFNSNIHLQQKGSGSSNNSPSLEANMNMSGGGDCVSNDSGVVSSGGGNFYGFYNANANQSGHYTDYHQQHQHHDGYSGGGGDQYYQQHRQDDSSGGSASVPVGHSNYFVSPVGTPNPNFPNSSGNSTPPARYGSPMVFPNNHGSYPQQQQQQQQHHPQQQQAMPGQAPLRRNSIESFSSEPGDMHGSYTTRYGCANSSAMNNMSQQHPNNVQQLNSGGQQFHQQGHNSFSGNPVKRECGGMNSRGSPSINPMTPNSGMNASGCWSPHQQPQAGGGYFAAPSPTGGCTSSSSPNPCPNSGGAKTNFMNTHHNSNNVYNQSACGVGGGESGNCSSNFYAPHEAGHHHNPHQTTQFKSCVYEQSQQHHDIKEGIPSMVANSPNGNLKAASAVKHRSISLSMPLPSYMEGTNSSRSDINSGNFINQPHHPHRQLPPQNHNHPHHQHPHQLHNNQAFNPMMSTSPHQHQQCPTTTGLVPPPEQNLLTPNSDDDIPFRAASAGGQSDMDSSYETMGDEGCSSTSTSVASHCMSSSVNTSGPSCSGVDTSNTGTSVTIANTTSGHVMHPMSVGNESDCHHHHHHHNPHLLYSSSSSSVSSCMQTHHHPHHHQHHHVASTMGMGLLGLPSSTIGLRTTNVHDLDDSSSDSSSVELHNVISAVVENSSIETPENTMMGDEGEDEAMGGPMSSDHHNQDSLTNVNIISTTTNEPDDDNVDGHNNEDDDDDDDDNCSESSMSHINSSFTADMFCNNSSNSIMSTATDNTTTTTINNQNAGDYKPDGIINSSNDFLCIAEEGNFPPPDNSSTSSFKKTANSSNTQFLLKGSSFSPPPQAVSSPQKISKRSFSDADKDNVSFSNTTTTTSSSLSSVGGNSLASFGASFRKSGGGSMSIGSGGGESSVSASHSFKKDGKKLDEISESSANANANFSNDNCGSSNNNNNNNSNNNNGVNNTGDISSCKAIDIIISSTNNNGSIMDSGKSGNGGNKDHHRVSIPKGWKREILKGASANEKNNGATPTGTTTTTMAGVVYISPSDTKIRNLDELKNYIGSDGTCKCGLSCPLRLEVAFCFDPKVTNMTAEDEKENLESLNRAAITGGCTNGGRNGTSSSSPSTSSSATPAPNRSSATKSNATIPGSSSGESDSRLLCNHKRKIPKAEDSPLISSTRDDLGDFGEKLKKRRMSGNECLGEKLVSSGPFGKDPITTSASNNGSSNTNASGSNNNTNTGGTSSTNNASQNVPVPFCQQSPDTTTQTPQTEMSPASSVCSDSSTILFSSTGSSAGGSNSGGNRSLTSTPTPTLSSSTTTSSISAAAAPTAKFGSSPSQGQGHCEFVWPSPPLQTGTIQLPQQLVNQPNTLWLNPNNSIATFSPSPIGSSSNSLTLNYVQSPNNVGGIVCGNVNGKGLPTGPINNIVISQAALPSQTSVAITTTAPSSTPAISTSTSTASTSTKKSNTYHPYPSKTVKRSSSPCPNIDVRQLPLEQNRPPPPLPSATQTISKMSPSMSIAPALSTLGTPTPTTITSLPTLPIVTNPNILFTVTPPIMTANTSLSTPTLPILPLLTTTGKLPTMGQIDASCGGPTILTTLQPNTSIFNAIDTNTLYPAVVQNKETPIIPSPKQQQSGKAESRTVSPAVSNSETKIQPKKKAEESAKNEKEINPSISGKSQGKGKASSSSGNTTGGDKSPLQLAQDIVNRFEKKSGEKTGNKMNENKSGNSNTTTTSSKETKAEEKEKAKERPTPKSATKPTKDGNKAVVEKCNNNDDVAAVAKTDSSSSKLSSSQPNKGDAGTNKTVVKAGANEPVINKNSTVADAGSKAEVGIVRLDDKSKVPADTSKQQPQQSIVPPPPNTNHQLPLSNTILTGPMQLPQQQPGENTIITSQTSAMSTTPLIFKDGLQLATDQGLTLTTSVSAPIPTISLSAMGNQFIQTSGAPVPCSTTITAGGLSTFATAGGNQIILQPPQVSSDHGNGANPTFITTSAGTGQLRYPILQTIQPLFLNSAGPAGGPLILSQPTQHSQDHTQGNHHGLAQQSFIYDQNGNPTATFDASGAFQSMLQPTTTTMVLDPSLCAGNNLTAGGKKKKKRLSKKQQQQQAQLQFQQQLILQQIQQQQQAAALAPLTIFPQSFNLGPQGFSLQPTMNFFSPPTTFLTLPNLILNPADGTLFIQPSTPLPTATTAPMQQTTMKLGQFPLTTTTTISQNPQNIAPKKDGMPLIIHNMNEPLKPASTPGLDPGSDDSRQNPTPDSSTNDLQLGLINAQTNTITLNIPAPTTTTVLHNPSPLVSKKNSKSRTVSSSSTTVKRILPQKQILPKIDSTTPSTTENAS